VNAVIAAKTHRIKVINGIFGGEGVI